MHAAAIGNAGVRGDVYEARLSQQLQTTPDGRRIAPVQLNFSYTASSTTQGGQRDAYRLGPRPATARSSRDKLSPSQLSLVNTTFPELAVNNGQLIEGFKTQLRDGIDIDGHTYGGREATAYTINKYASNLQCALYHMILAGREAPSSFNRPVDLWQAANWAIPLMVQGGPLDTWLIDHGHADRPSAGTSGKVQNWRLSLQFLYDGMRRNP